jgi:tRNA pseudouridine13 synthase
MVDASPELLLSTADLPGVGGSLGREPEDFQVDEVPAYAASGAGEHVYVRIRKRELTTRAAIGMLARAASVRERDIGYAGLKDKHAVTTQWLSLPKSPLSPESWKLPPGLELVEVSRHNNKLRTGHLSGNRFTVGLVGVDDAGLVRARALLDRLERDGLYNYFGDQRFGSDRDNLSHALAWIRGTERVPRHRERFLSKLYPSVIQSEVFNRYLTLRAAHGFEKLLPGEVVRLDGTGSLFVVEEPEKEQPRLAARDIHPSGPIVGPKMRRAARLASDLEERAIAEAGLTSTDIETLGRHAPGTRRDLLVFPKDVEVSWSGDRLVVSFELPAGSYATVLIRELIRKDPRDFGAGDGAEAESED